MASSIRRDHEVPHLDLSKCQPIEEDSTAMKLLCCIPILGIIVSLRSEIGLWKKFKTEESQQRAVQLIEVKNDYKGAAVIRSLLSSAVIIAGVVSGFFAKQSFVSAGLFVGLAAWHFYQICQNVNTQDEIIAKGLRPGLILH